MIPSTAFFCCPLSYLTPNQTSTETATTNSVTVSAIGLELRASSMFKVVSLFDPLPSFSWGPQEKEGKGSASSPSAGLARLAYIALAPSSQMRERVVDKSNDFQSKPKLSSSKPG